LPIWSTTGKQAMLFLHPLLHDRNCRHDARLDLIDLASDLAPMQRTTFYIDSELIHSLLEEDGARKKP
jgi:hypothetical protein